MTDVEGIFKIAPCHDCGVRTKCFVLKPTDKIWCYTCCMKPEREKKRP